MPARGIEGVVPDGERLRRLIKRNLEVRSCAFPRR